MRAFAQILACLLLADGLVAGQTIEPTVVVKLSHPQQVASQSAGTIQAKVVDLLRTSNFNSKDHTSSVFPEGTRGVQRRYRTAVEGQYLVVVFPQPQQFQLTRGEITVIEVIVGLNNPQYADSLFTIDPDGQVVEHSKFSGNLATELLELIMKDESYAGSAVSQPTKSPMQGRLPPSPDERVRQTAAESGAEYTDIFTELGLKPEEQTRAKSQLSELHRKAIAAGEPMTELLTARMAYDKEIHAALGDTNYLRYRDYEESKPARREYELVREYAMNSNNLAMDNAFRDRIVQLIKDTKATTTETWHGPYDPRPHPEVGQQMVLAQMNRDLLRFRQASSNLINALSKSGLPEPYQRLLKNYCSHKIREMEEQTTRMSLPEEELGRRMRRKSEREFQEQMLKRRANSTDLLF